ncbi:MAG: ethanolamine ammonia-lyase subunit EutC [Gemmatimonadales bacterium]|nr:ethanolamine ammonia-lyase subunit EutC [Gemmatimonadales bacterium]
MTLPDLRALTAARLDLGATGVSVPLRAELDFRLAHARARDAVARELDVPALCAALADAGLHSRTARSRVGDRREHLLRPDLGRRLAADDAAALDALNAADGWDLACVVADGLAALAAERHAVPLLSALLPSLRAEGWRIAPIIVATGGRVALGDDVGERLGARLVLVLLGERPGLGAPDSLGAYLTWAPRVGTLDSERNCVSNIRPGGLPPAQAAMTLGWLLREARRRAVSGVTLKDEAGEALPPG